MTTRRRGPRRCRCCGVRSESDLCAACGAESVRHALVVRAAILATFGTAGLTRYETALRTERAQRGEGRKTGPVQDVVTPAPPDAGDDPLITQVGMEAPLTRAGANQLGEGVGVRFRSQAMQRPLVVRGENPPRRLALGSVLPDQDRPLRVAAALPREHETRH